MIKLDNISDTDIQAIVDKMLHDKEEKNQKRSQFIKTSIFQIIINTMISKEIFLDEEHFRYFPQETLEKFSLSELTVDHIDLFIDCMTDNDLIPPENTFIEEDNDFDNTTSEKLGLKVFMMWGQGCCIQIFPASISR